MRFSATRLETWMDCQMKAKFRYVDKLPTRQGSKQSFGVIIHHILQRLVHDLDVPAALDEFQHLWEHPTELDSELEIEVWKGSTYGGLLNRGIEIIKTFVELREWDTSEVIGTEIPFLVRLGRHEVTGYIDLLEIRRSGNGKLVMRVCDYKTSSYKPSAAKLRNNVQFTIYEYATSQREFWLGNGDDFPGIPNGEELMRRYADIPRRPIWIHLWNYQELDAGERDEADYMRLNLAFEQIERANELGLYIPDISGETCSICDFTEPCGVRIPEPGEIANEENAWL